MICVVENRWSVVWEHTTLAPWYPLDMRLRLGLGLGIHTSVIHTSLETTVYNVDCRIIWIIKKGARREPYLRNLSMCLRTWKDSYQAHELDLHFLELCLGMAYGPTGTLGLWAKQALLCTGIEHKLCLDPLALSVYGLNKPCSALQWSTSFLFTSLAFMTA